MQEASRPAYPNGLRVRIRQQIDGRWLITGTPRGPYHQPTKEQAIITAEFHCRDCPKVTWDIPQEARDQLPAYWTDPTMETP